MASVISLLEIQFAGIVPLGVHRQPIALLGVLVEDAVTGVIDEEVVVRAKLAAKLGQGPKDVAARGVQEKLDGKPVVAFQHLRDTLRVIDGRP